MSTKIYNGFIMPGMSMADLMTLCDKFRKKAEEYRLVSLEKDELFVSKPESFLDRVEKVRREHARDPKVDYGFDVCFYSLRDHILGMYFCERRDLVSLWFLVSGAKEYHYQNQTDPPDEMTEEEWLQREEDWDIVLSASSTPSEAMFCIKLLDTIIPFWHFKSKGGRMVRVPSRDEK